MATEPDWRRLNRANWDERVPIHLAAPAYDLAALRAGRGRLHSIETAELGPVAGLRLAHLQCHFGRDTLTLAQLGARVTGLDFSAPAVAAARDLAAELGHEADFVQADVYDARAVLDGVFDRVFTTWGTICWLPDVARWAQVVASLLAPGGVFYFADAHPAALVLDDATGADGLPGWFAPYFQEGVLEIDETRDYADPTVRLIQSRTQQFIHSVGSVVSALLGAGLRVDMLHEHDRVPWRMFTCLVADDAGEYRWPDRPWLPLAWSLRAVRDSAPR